VSADRELCDELARLGAATVYEASGREGLVDCELRQIVPGSRACGPARTVRCGQGDNLMVHAAMSRLAPGEVLVLTMPEPAAVALIGDLLMTQAKVAGAVAVLNDAAARDTEELAGLGLPVWTRFTRSRGATKEIVGELDVPVVVGGRRICPGDLVVLDGGGEGTRQAREASAGSDLLRPRRAAGDRRRRLPRRLTFGERDAGCGAPAARAVRAGSRARARSRARAPGRRRARAR
jgi:4-hydroxy-4-methyl-2-oxoglutarate aldolase